MKHSGRKECSKIEETLQTGNTVSALAESALRHDMSRFTGTFLGPFFFLDNELMLGGH